MNKYRILVIWVFLMDLLDKILCNTYLVATSLLLILIFGMSKTNNKYSFNQDVIILILGIIAFASGILMRFMAVNNTYPLSISTLISFAGGMISYLLFDLIRGKKHTQKNNISSKH